MNERSAGSAPREKTIRCTSHGGGGRGGGDGGVCAPRIPSEGKSKPIGSETKLLNTRRSRKETQRRGRRGGGGVGLGCWPYDCEQNNSMYCFTCNTGRPAAEPSLRLSRRLKSQFGFGGSDSDLI